MQAKQVMEFAEDCLESWKAIQTAVKNEATCQLVVRRWSTLSPTEQEGIIEQAWNGIWNMPRTQDEDLDHYFNREDEIRLEHTPADERVSQTGLVKQFSVTDLCGTQLLPVLLQTRGLHHPYHFLKADLAALSCIATLKDYTDGQQGAQLSAADSHTYVSLTNALSGEDGICLHLHTAGMLLIRQLGLYRLLEGCVSSCLQHHDNPDISTPAFDLVQWQDREADWLQLLDHLPDTELLAVIERRTRTFREATLTRLDKLQRDSADYATHHTHYLADLSACDLILTNDRTSGAREKALDLIFASWTAGLVDTYKLPISQAVRTISSRTQLDSHGVCICRTCCLNDGQRKQRRLCFLAQWAWITLAEDLPMASRTCLWFFRQLASTERQDAESWPELSATRLCLLTLYLRHLDVPVVQHVRVERVPTSLCAQLEHLEQLRHDLDNKHKDSDLIIRKARKKRRLGPLIDSETVKRWMESKTATVISRPPEFDAVEALRELQLRTEATITASTTDDVDKRRQAKKAKRAARRMV